MRALSLTSLPAATVISAFLLSTTASAQAPLRFDALDKDVSLSVGVLAQNAFQRDMVPAGPPVIDAGFRRLRLIAAGSIGNRVRFFLDTDTPYLGYHGAPGWNVPPTVLQDLAVMVKAGDGLTIDAGLLMVPMSYNTTQGAASLLAVGYGPYSFLASAPTHSRMGRDQGVQARGYVVGQHLEYRVGAFRGASKHLDNMPLRYAGRAVWYPLGAQTGLFYAGTLHGARKMASIGTSYDRQGNYASHAVDMFVEWPLGGNSVTTQVDYVRYDGGRTFLQLPQQNTWLVESGYECRRARLGLFVQLARQDLTSPTAADAAAYQTGVIWWGKGHTLNIKLGVGQTLKTGTSRHTQVVVQSQMFVF